MKRFALPCLILAVTFAPLQAQPDERVQRWVEKILSGPEFGGTGKHTITMWVKPKPTMSVFGADAEQLRVVTAAVEHINETLAKTPLQGIVLLKPNDPSAEIRMTFCNLKEMPAVAKQLGFRYVEGNWGYFNYWYNARREHYKAHILMASDKLKGKWLRHYALEETIQVLGLVNDSDEFEDSIFYERNNITGDAQNLSPLDKKLIVFFFNYMRPGDTQADLRAKLAKHWGKDDPVTVKPMQASWLEEIVLGAQFGGEGRVVARYVGTPKLSIFRGDADQAKLIKTCVDHLNETLAHTPLKRIEIVAPKDAEANIHVYFTPLRELPDVARMYGFEYQAGSATLFWSFWNARREMTRTILLVATDQVEGKALHHGLLQQLTRSLGPMNFSQRDASSIFCLQENKPGPTELSAKDRALLRFFFNHLSPGDTPEQVRHAMRQHWRE